MISLKIHPKMRQALKNLARKEFASVSGLIKKAIQEHLERKGINWEKVEVEPDDDK